MEYGQLGPDQSRVLGMLASRAVGWNKYHNNGVLQALMCHEHFFMTAKAYCKDDLWQLCKDMRLSVPTTRTREDFVQAVHKYRKARQQSKEKHCQLLDIRGTTAEDSAPPSHWWEISEELSSQYQSMPECELQAEVDARCLSSSSLDPETMKRQARGTNTRQLRKRLRESDEAFSRCFPKQGLQYLDAKGLRKLATDIGVQQGDQTVATLAENLTKLAEQRQKGKRRRTKQCAAVRVEDFDGAGGWRGGWHGMGK